MYTSDQIKALMLRRLSDLYMLRDDNKGNELEEQFACAIEELELIYHVAFRESIPKITQLDNCDCICHKDVNNGGWNSIQCCPDCGSSLVDYKSD